MDTVAKLPDEPLTRAQSLTFLSLSAPWLLLLALTWLNPEFLGLFLLSKTGIASVVVYLALTVLQGWLLRRTYRRINTAKRRNGGHTVAAAMIFGIAALGALELFAVAFTPVVWARIVAPGT